MCNQSDLQQKGGPSPVESCRYRIRKVNFLILCKLTHSYILMVRPWHCCSISCHHKLFIGKHNRLYSQSIPSCMKVLFRWRKMCSWWEFWCTYIVVAIDITALWLHIFVDFTYHLNIGCCYKIKLAHCFSWFKKLHVEWQGKCNHQKNSQECYFQKGFHGCQKCNDVYSSWRPLLEESY